MEEIKERYYSKCIKRLDKINHRYIPEIKEEIETSFRKGENVIYYSIDKIEKMIKESKNKKKIDTLFNIYRDVNRISFYITRYEEN